MDEISYWIYTKRAPCLMSYDNAKKLSEEAQCSKTNPESVPGLVEVPAAKRKKKRKLSLLDAESASDVQANVYFDTSFQQKKVVPSCKSDTLRSDVDFNIRNASVTGKTKKSKLQKSRTGLHKKNRVVTSTPKVSILRRSLRQARQSHNNNSQLNSSFEILDNSVLNGNHLKNGPMEQKSAEKTKKPTELLAGGDQTVHNKKNIIVNKYNKLKTDVLNGQFEDLSDVSGFTANYIRSTKIQSKTPRKLRCKNNRNLVKESQQSEPKESTMVVCMNKSVNTASKPAALNCSTESENVINLVTSKSNDKSAKLSKSTSLLKFMDSRNFSKKESGRNKFESSRRKSKTNLNVSFHSQNTPSRYPKRCRNQSTQEIAEENTDVSQIDKKIKNCKISHDFNNSDRKENPDNNVSKTRSGRNIGLALRQPENSVLVLSNSTEQVSSMVSMNVASLVAEPKEKIKRKKRVTRHLRSNKSVDRRASLRKDSARDCSGFAACFSDSEDDSEPLQKKFFCA